MRFCVGAACGARAVVRLPTGAFGLTEPISTFAVLIFVVAAYMLWKSAGEAF